MLSRIQALLLHAMGANHGSSMLSWISYTFKQWSPRSANLDSRNLSQPSTMKYLPGAFGSSAKAAYPKEDVKADNESDYTVESFQPARPSTLKRCLVISITLIAFAILGYTINRLILSVNHKDLPQNTSSCRQPAIRKEWRSLGQNEKTNYIAAVQCLSTHPSTLNSVGTWNDDFAWIHKHIGMESRCSSSVLKINFMCFLLMVFGVAHFSAAFLSWHRYFISVYETLLKDKCNYGGNLP